MDDLAASPAIATLVAAGVLRADPLPWVLSSAEPWARWVALTGISDVAEDDPRAMAVRLQVVAHPSVRDLIATLPAWDAASIGDHHSPLFAPNRLGLLADMGVRAGDDTRLDALADAMLASRDRQGRFTVPEALAARPKPERGSVVCDSNAIVDVLSRLGFGNDPRVIAAQKRLVGDVAASPQGRGWRCLPEKRPLIDLGARRLDACPQVTLEGARSLSRVPQALRPSWAPEVARTLLTFWNRRGDERPYEFGHGYQFKTVKWPSFWYDVLAVLDAVSRFPSLWRDGTPLEDDRRAIAELAAVLVAHNVAEDGRVSPLRVHRGLEPFSFGRRGEPSPYATARVLDVLARLTDLAEDIAAVDVEALAHSRPLSHSGPGPSAGARTCPVPQRRTYDPARVLPRVLTRHHLGAQWESASAESLAADIVGFTAGDRATPYLSMAARFPGFEPAVLDSALDSRRSLVRLRCMRGALYAVRRDFVGVVHAASVRQVVRYARDFAVSHGVNAADYEATATRVLAASTEEPLTTAELRARIKPNVDLAAVVTLMCAEARLARCAPRDGRFGHHTTYAPFEQVLPDVHLDRVSEDDARARLLHAYVRGFGPVSARDAAWWTGMDLKRVRRAFDALEEELVEISLAEVDGTWLMHAADAEELERASFSTGENVVLLPALDPLLLSYTDRSRFVSDAVRPYVFDAARNVTSVVLVNGRVAGVWDAAMAPQPAALVHLLADADTETRTTIEAEARRMAGLRLGVDNATVRFVQAMVPLSERTIGAFRHPLH